MSKPINILPPAIYNRLAAGEVVENPASIVKELVENSLDAGADKISVTIKNGGLDEIEVIDNGSGVDETNLAKVFLPHATSKIKTFADIDNIASLGFRGEAMASIAAVAKVTFTSKPKHQDYAACVDGQGHITQVGANDGTTVRVNDLFYNTPARKKFLRSATAEKNSVTEILQRVIFANPQIKLRYVADDKILLDYHGNGLRQAICQIFDVADENLLDVKSQNAVMSVSGVISNTHLTKPNKSRQVIIINNRVVNGGLPAFFVNEVMANYLPLHEFPIFVLHLKIATDKVDVNVHPQKKEVRFADKNALAQFIKTAITQTIDDYFLAEINKINVAKDTINVENKTTNLTPQFTGISFNPTVTDSQTVFLQSLELLADDSQGVASAPNILNAMQIDEPIPEVKEQVSVLNNNTFTILGQVFETYLLVRTPEALLLIDQHAMAERINYDKFRQQIDNAEKQTQMMLAPVVITLTPAEMNKFEKIQPMLTTFGFECDLFGDNTIRIAAIPAMMSQNSVRDFINIILDDKEVMTTTLSDTLKHHVATAACKASIKAGDVLTTPQIENFLQNYFTTKNIPLCPHGRPIMLVFNKSRLETLFARK